MNKKTLIEQFCYLSDTNPGAIALQQNTTQITYAELSHKVSQVSALFIKLGLQVGDRIALAVDNSIDYVTAFYAAWKIGAVVVALNPQAKFYEIDKMLFQCHASCLITDKLTESNIVRLSQKKIHLITLSKSKHEDVTNWHQAFDLRGDSSHFPAETSTLAQIIYTSGTTGNPKGVVLTHGNLLSNVQDIVTYLKLSTADSVLNVLPFHYCYGNSVLHTHLYVGAKVILAGSMAYPQEVVNSLRRFHATGFSGVASTFSLLLSRSDWSESPPALRYLTQAGGPMGKELTLKLVAESDYKTQLFVMYGQTEATARITWLPPNLLNSKLGSVGIPLKHVQLEVRNEKNVKIASYQKGEVYIKGPSVMQGYWENCAATKEVLIDGWLKTGDLGFLDDDGYLFLQGRNSDMIKVGAHRINPLELEEIINNITFVHESAVIGIDDPLLGQKLCAFIVGEESKSNLFAIKKHCNQYLPTHKIPKDIQWLASLPKTASGKIKRYQLIK